MSDPQNPNIQNRNTPQWVLYQREMFWKDNTGEVPPFSTDPGDLEDLAKDGCTHPATPDNPPPTSQTDRPSTSTE